MRSGREPGGVHIANVKAEVFEHEALGKVAAPDAHTARAGELNSSLGLSITWITMSIGDIIEGVFEVVRERAPRFAACLALSVAACFFVFWLVPGFVTKILTSIGLLFVGSSVGWLWERRA